MKNIKKTYWITFLLASFFTSIVYFVQRNAEDSLNSKCSYLDPWIIDLLAFLAALFLIIEGIYRMWENKEDRLAKQFSRIVRVIFGCTILTLHIMQFMYK